MRRRDFITGLGGAAAASSAIWPLAARAQQPGMPVIGFLSSGSPGDPFATNIPFFLRGLAETGYAEGRNVAIEYRWAEGHNDRLPALVADLIRRRVAVIVLPNNTASALAAKAATQTIPIVFLIGRDPVEIGLVASLNRPGGNVTGVASLGVEAAAKRFELLHELVPAATQIALLANPTNPVLSEAETREAQLAARVLGVRVQVLNASNATEIDAAFGTLVAQQAGALVVSADNLFLGQRDQLVAAVARRAVPTIYYYREQAAAGGLMSYGTNFPEAHQQVGVYAGRILNGEKPADLPVQRVTRIELVINMKTAKTLGLTFPLTLLGRADEVIE
jgi:putative tryptophan/tyrosine transport system substrate-binding protein